MTDFAMVDCHAHIFPPLAGASGFPTADDHLVHQQRAMHVHGNQPYRRLRDHAVMTERPLWRADDPSEAGRVTDVRFRVGRSGASSGSGTARDTTFSSCRRTCTTCPRRPT